MTSDAQIHDPRFHERDYALDRLILLSDGVFAIAMTLMALEVKPDGPWPHTLIGFLAAVANPFMAFFWSFFGTAIFWTTHRRIFSRIGRSTPALTVLTLFLLGQITLVPVATRALGELAVPAGAPLLLGLYGLIGVTNAATLLYARLAGLMSPPHLGPTTAAVLALSLALLPAGMTALGIYANLPDRYWLPAIIPPIIFLSLRARHLAEAYDQRKAAPRLPGATGADKVDTTPA